MILGVVSTFVALWVTAGPTVADAMGIATHEYHNQDMDRVETVLWCLYYEVPQQRCPISPPDAPAGFQFAPYGSDPR
jgi:hypothetical protein